MSLSFVAEFAKTASWSETILRLHSATVCRTECLRLPERNRARPTTKAMFTGAGTERAARQVRCFLQRVDRPLHRLSDKIERERPEKGVLLRRHAEPPKSNSIEISDKAADDGVRPAF